MDIGSAIKLIRTQKNLSQSELAREADISVSYLSMVERGKRNPSFSTVESIAEALKVPLSIMAFLAADPNEIGDISPELAKELSLTALQLIKAAASESTRI